MGFWEELPLQCPPEDAQDVEIEVAYRVVFSNPVTKEHFRSHRYLGIPSSSGDECRHASCSLWTSADRARQIAEFPKLKPRNPWIASMIIPKGSGLSRAKRDHIDLWIYDDFDPLSAVIAVEPV